MRRIRKYLRENEINLLASVLFPLVFSLLLYLTSLAWSDTAPHDDAWSTVQIVLSVLWLTPLPVAFISFLGILLYKTGTHLEDSPQISIGDSALYFRLVTRGNNQVTVSKTANAVVGVMERFNQEFGATINYVMEIVTEPVQPSLAEKIAGSFWAHKIQVIELPTHYATRNNARYKARALQYALEYSSARDQDWIFHLDDESQIDRTTVLGILEFISREEQRLQNDPHTKPLVGQGTILYHRNIRESSLYTLADSIRTADDIGRYFFQYILGICIFGMHGSFILCRTSAEKEEGFDLHPHFCITEDAYWGLRMMQRGYRFGHVYGFVHEQSPAKGMDFIKQRRRWFLGMTKVLQSRTIAMKYKFILIVSTFLWALSGFVVMYTALNIIHPVPIPPVIGILSVLSFSIYIVMYTIGFYVNIKYTKLSLLHKIVLFTGQLFFLPVFSMLEAAGALYGLLDRQLNFYVIKK